MENPVEGRQLINRTKLPDVDTSQKDVFETEDFDETTSSQNIDVIKENNNESIDKANVSSKEALQKFSDKSLDISKEDYNQNTVIRKKRIQRGGFVQANDYEIGALPAQDETPLQRFHRLQFEVKKFLEDLKEKKEVQVEEGKKKKTINPTQMAEELSYLQIQLNELMKDEKYESVLNPTYEIEQSAKLQEGLSKKLVNEITNFTKSDQVSDTKSQTGGSSSVTYELYYAPNTIKQLQGSKLAEVEKRISELESLVGQNRTGSSVNLIATIDQLREKLSTLTPTNIESFHKNVANISKEIDLLLEKQKTLQVKPPVEKKINELFELMSKWDSTANQLPVIVSRLKALKLLHEEAATFSQNVRELESQQDEIKKLLKADTETLKMVEESFKNNLTVIQNNVTSLENRINNVMKKLESTKH